VRSELGRGPDVYGLLLTCIGIGAVAGAFALPRLRARFRRDVQVAAASVLYALSALALAYVRNLALLAIAMMAIGVAWIAILSALQVAAQLTLPEWVRARGLAAFVMVFMGGLTLGSILWGQVATHLGVPLALTIAAAGMLAAIALTRSFRLVDQARDFTPSMDWTPPVLAETPEPDAGPVMVTVEYRVDLEKRREFVEAMQHVREMRKRNGAYFWELFHDSAEPSRYVEIFLDESWTEHLRQHERASVSDRAIHARAKRFLQEPGSDGKSEHWLADR
jgi:MFS family permease